MTTLSPHRPVHPPRPAPVHACSAAGCPGGGGVLAILTGARADADVAAHAGRLAARTGRKVTAAVAFRSNGFSVNALLHITRHRRLTHQAEAVLAPAPDPSPQPVTTAMPSSCSPPAPTPFTAYPPAPWRGSPPASVPQP
ncbi:hypothetical protein [Streptomyces sp. NPDC058964]|uniref:hypothetical protein n=1 Tax=Streptomyces sp. NPDC058964 TaxID=3346681 RepID=UPI0036C82F95